MQTEEVQNLLNAYIQCLKQEGYSPPSIEKVQRASSHIQQFQDVMHYETMDDILAGFSTHVHKRYENGEIQKPQERFYLRIVTQLRLGNETGKFNLRLKNLPSFEGSQVFAETLQELETADVWTKRSQENVLVAAKSLFVWMDKNGLSSLQDISTDVLRKYLFNQIQKSRTKNIQDTRHNLKYLMQYLSQNKGMALEDCVSFLMLPIPVPERLYPPAKAEHIVAALDVIDRDTAIGKRDYAIILMGATTGFRSCDICNLKLDDFDWRSGQIHFVQKKTGITTFLPITTDIGDAISDYILNGRKAVPECRFVFTRTVAPFTGISPKTPNAIYNKYLKMAGIDRTPDDGLSFHSLRRFVGTQLIKSGSTIDTTAQVLGHTDIHSTEKYLSFDSKNLKACSLSLKGIEFHGGNPHV